MSYAKIITSILLLIAFNSCTLEVDKAHLIFIHARYPEINDLDIPHPQHGLYEYEGIIKAFKDSGLNVTSTLRKENVNARDFAAEISIQIDSLISSGIPASKITIAGTSKGGYIAQYVSTLANNEELNFVFIASFQEADIENIPEINFCGRILTIYDSSDPYGVSAIERKKSSQCRISQFEEIELDLRMGHGFIFKPLQEWIGPTSQWAKGQTFN